MAQLPAVVNAALAEILSIFSLPGGAAGPALIQTYLNRRMAEARDILLEEYSKAEITELDVASEDELAGILFRYFRATRENAARINLRLMAKVMLGLGQRDRLFADEFNKYAEILSRLSRDEMLVIGTLHRYRKEEERRQGPLVGTGQYWPKVMKELVPDQFPTEEHVIAVCCSGMRSGLILTPRDFDSTGSYATSPIMDEVAELADFQAVLVDEGETSGARR